jgi:hypothetical protein
MVDPTDDSLTIEPYGFFTREALGAGWYLAWRQLIRVVPLAAGAIAVGAGLGRVGLVVVGLLIMGLGLAAASIWAALLIPRLASQWAVVTYGYPLTSALRVWWAIAWRTSVAALVASVILTPPQFVALSLSTSFPGSALDYFGKLLSLLLNLASFVVALFAMGWAVSRVTSAQLSGLPLAPVGFPPTEPISEPVSAGPVAVDARAAVSAPRSPSSPGTAVMASATATPVAASPTSRPGAPAAVLQSPRSIAAAEGKRQCPKCGLYETERGSVIGWYCTICGWRESRR